MPSSRAHDTSHAWFPPGAGEMWERIRTHDWALTSLGPMNTWPPSLRHAVSMMLASKTQIILFWGPSFVVLYNDAYRQVLGAKHPASLGRPGHEVWSEIWNSMLHQLLEGVVGSSEAFFAEDLLFPLQRFGYTEDTYFNVSYDPLHDDAGAVAGVYCIVTETTGRVVGERRLGVLKDLAAQVANARTVREACEVAMRTLAWHAEDVPFAELYVDGALHGQTPGAEAARRTTDLASVRELPLPAAAPTGQPGRLVVGLNPRRPFDDQYRDFLDLVANQIASAIANAQAYEDERHRAETLAELDRAKTSFFTNVSHEFRTPLTLMLGPLDHLRSRLPAGDTLELVETAERNAHRLLRLVNSLLDFARVEGGRAAANFEPIDLGELTADLASTFRTACETAGLTLRVDATPLPKPVYVDREQWETIVLNLISNAFKFTFAGTIVVSVSPADDGAHAELCVRDTGVGIPSSQMGHLFGRFQRVDGVRGRSIEGSGIGLALVQELVKLHGGTIRAQSVEGEGTTFTVSLPYGCAHLPTNQVRPGSTSLDAGGQAAAFVGEAMQWIRRADQRADANVDPLDASPVRRRMSRVLIVEDNSDLRAYLTRLLERSYTVLSAADGDEALDLALAEPPDLVLSDAMMPGLDGLTLTARLRADPRTRTIPVLLLSARAGEDARIDGLGAGADDYITKPFSTRELHARIAAQLATAKVRTDAEASLRASEDKYRSLFGSIDEGFTIIELMTDDEGRTVDYRFVETNDVFEQQTGLTNVIGRSARELVPDIESLWLERYLEVAATGQAARFEAESVAMGRWFDVYASRLGGPGSALIAVVFRDITDRRRREASSSLLDRISKDLARLTDPDDIMQAVGRHLGEALRLSGCILVDVNEGADEVTVHFGWTTHGVPSLKQTFRLGDYLTENFTRAGRAGETFVVTDTARDPRTHRDAYARLSVGAFVTIPFHWQRRWTAFMAVTSITPRAWRDDEVELLREVSNRLFLRVERARAEDALRASRDELRESDRRKDEFLATLAHELRNPLAPVRTSVALMRTRPLQDPLLERSRDIVERQVAQMSRLLDDLLDISRLSQGKLTLRPVRTTLREIIEAAIETSLPLLEKKHQTLTTDYALTDIALDADPARLTQLFGNLLNNASKFSPAHTPITLRVALDDESAVITVRDRGVGISAELLPSVFDLFTQVDSANDLAPGGLGIGLALARRLVELHGGTIEASSDGPGRGSTFTVRLPAVEGVNDLDSRSAHASPAERMLPPRRVLIVDDNADAADTIALLLGELGCIVHTVYGGAAALREVQTFNPDVVFLDLGMPDVDGHEVCEGIRSEPWGQQMTLIALTGWGREADRTATSLAGFDGHVVKPADPATLVQLVRDLPRRQPSAGPPASEPRQRGQAC